MKKIELIPTKVKNLETLINGAEGAFLSSRNNTVDLKELFERYESQNRLELFKSVLDLKTVGFISLFHSDKNNSVSIGPMYINEKFRGKGFGKIQVEKLLKYCEKNKYHIIKTKTWSKNIASRKIFEKLGFQVYEEIPNDRSDGDSTVKYVWRNENEK